MGIYTASASRGMPTLESKADAAVRCARRWTGRDSRFFWLLAAAMLVLRLLTPGAGLGYRTSALAAVATGASAGPWQEEQRLSAADWTWGSDYGGTVALSADGNTAVIGAGGTQGHDGRGTIYFYARAGQTWRQTAELVHSRGASQDGFPSAVALNADGTLALIGAMNATVRGHAGQGAVYIYARTGHTWHQTATLAASDGNAGDRFGMFVSLSGDGRTALIGAPGSLNYPNDPGAAYVFARAGATWRQTAKLAERDGVGGDLFGCVALSADGQVAVVGAWNRTVGTLWEEGTVYVFTRTGSVWRQVSELTSGDRNGYQGFGLPVAVSANGATILIGARWDGEKGLSQVGAAYVYTRTGDTWRQTRKLTAADAEEGNEFGNSLALSTDGSTALIGAPDKLFGGYQPGAIYAFAHAGATWRQTGELIVEPKTDVDGSVFGLSAALDAKGRIALIGAPAKNSLRQIVSGSDAFVFTRSGS